VIQRTGSIPGAKLTLIVSDDGNVRCDGGPPRRMSDRLLLTARQLARDLAVPASRRLRLPRRPGSVLSYRIRLATGSVSFSDNSPGLPAALRPVQGLTRDIARQACGLAR
jgi:hypothetical protein